MSAASSSRYSVWRRFRRNLPALVGLIFIMLATGLALFGYLVVPDSSPDANTQLPELALRPPGSRAYLLPVRLDHSGSYTGWWGRLLHGRPADYRWIPVMPETLHSAGDSLYFRREGGSAKEEAIHVVHLRFAGADSVWREGDHYAFAGEDGRVQRLPRNDPDLSETEDAVLQQRFFLLGTDKYGRCIFSRLLLGFRVSLTVGAIAVALSLLLGVALGALGGWFGGRVDDAVMLLINTAWSIPTLLLVFAIILALGRGLGVIFVAVGLTMWVDVARLVRGQVISLKAMPFIEAAKSLGLGWRRILLRHVFPNLMGPLLVVTAANFATAILVESGLSYLGFGVQPPALSWGTMLYENYGYAISGRPFLALAPALTIALTVLAFNLAGNGLRDAASPRPLQGRG